MGYVPQGTGDALNPVLSVRSQVAESPFFVQGLGWPEAREGADHFLNQMGLSRSLMRARPYAHRLSGGMIQRTLLAAGLASCAPLLLVDEPTKGLDPVSRDQILRLLLSF